MTEENNSNLIQETINCLIKTFTESDKTIRQDAEKRLKELRINTF